MVKCKRLLLPVALGLTLLPIYIEILRNVVMIAILYFFSSLMLLFNFPWISLYFHSKPKYVEDIDIGENTENYDLRTIYETIMVFVMAIMIGLFADYIFLQEIKGPTLEIIAFLGGIYSFYIKLQNIIGSILLKVFVKWKKQIVHDKS